MDVHMKKKKLNKTPQRLSFTKINTFLSCGEKYRLHYIEKIRPTALSSALAFGKALDTALNDLLINKNLTTAYQTFQDNFTEIGLQYYPNDYDQDLLDTEDVNVLDKLQVRLYGHSSENILDDIKTIDGDFSKLDKKELTLLSTAYWLSLRQKGIIILDSYNSWVMPKIEEVYEIQHKTVATNNEGDELEGTFDLIAKIKGEGNFILDNKTSSYPYEKNSAETSPQLLTYDTIYKGNVKINGVGFIVGNKNIWKKKKKICETCSFDNSQSSHRTCANMVNGARCHGRLEVTIDKKCFIDIILSKPNEQSRQLVLKTIENVGELIKKKVFTPNWNSCKMGKTYCPYYNYCHYGKMDGLKKE